MTTPGNFTGLRISNTDKMMFDDAYKTLTSLDLWDWLKQDSVPGNNGFMFSVHPQIADITNAMTYKGHSGASFGLTMRTMEYIAKKGWDKFVYDLTCPCRRSTGGVGWCGVAGGGVPACEH